MTGFNRLMEKAKKNCVQQQQKLQKSTPPVYSNNSLGTLKRPAVNFSSPVTNSLAASVSAIRQQTSKTFEKKAEQVKRAKEIRRNELVTAANEVKTPSKENEARKRPITVPQSKTHPCKNPKKPKNPSTGLDFTKLMQMANNNISGSGTAERTFQRSEMPKENAASAKTIGDTNRKNFRKSSSQITKKLHTTNFKAVRSKTEVGTAKKLPSQNLQVGKSGANVQKLKSQVTKTNSSVITRPGGASSVPTKKQPGQNPGKLVTPRLEPQNRLGIVSASSKLSRPLLPHLEQTKPTKIQKPVKSTQPKGADYGGSRPMLPFLERAAPAKRKLNSYYEEEEDSDLDDFIVDDEEEAARPGVISKLLRSITGYDPTQFNDDGDDCRNMESSYKDIAREEKLSAKIAKREDMEDLRLEQERAQKKQQRKLEKIPGK